MAAAHRFSDLPDYAFPRLRRLLDSHAPGGVPNGPVVAMSIGEPTHPMPAFVGEVIADNLAGFATYPPNDGTPELLAAISAWIARRYGATVGPDRLMALSTSRVGSTAVVTVTGELDLYTSRELMTAVDATLESGDLAAVVIDLTGVTFLGSSGLGTLAPASRRPDESPVPVRLVAAADNRAVIRPWETMNLQQILPLYPDVDAAVAGIAPS